MNFKTIQIKLGDYANFELSMWLSLKECKLLNFQLSTWLPIELLPKKNTETSNKEVVESRLWLRSSWNQFSSSWYHFKWFLSCGKTHVWLSLMESIGLFSLSMHQCIVTTRWWAIGNLTARASSCIGHFVQENMRCCCWNRNIFAVDESVQRD